MHSFVISAGDKGIHETSLSSLYSRERRYSTNKQVIIINRKY